MNRKTFRYPFFSRDDLSAFWALFADNLANMIIASGVCAYVLDIPNEIVFGRILPGLGVALVVGLLFYAFLARRLALRERRGDVTALPYGISTPILFVYLFLIMKPVHDGALADGLAPADAGLMAWRVGIAAAFLGGVLEALGAAVGPALKKILPRAGMLGTLAGIALVWIATVPLAEVFEDPIVGFGSLTIVFIGLIALYRLPLGIPAGLAAIAVGTAIGFATGESSFNLEGTQFYCPLPVVGDLLEGLKILFANPWVLAIVIPAEIYNFIETMNNVESAEAAGDSYPVGTCQVMDGVGTMAGAIFGSAFPTTVYIGHPGYKRLRARAGYAVGVGAVFFVGSLFGLVAFLYHLIPVAACAPILVYIGVVIVGQAFRASPPAHAMAVCVAMIPHVSNLLFSKWCALAKVLSKEEGILLKPETVAALKQEGCHLLGHAALFNGSIVIGLLWGTLTAFLLDGKLLRAALVAIAAMGLTATGLIHSPTLGFQITPIFWGYLIIAGVCVLIRASGAEQELPRNPADG